ncbi:polysaccharide pyruvyl transferase family protein [Microbacterium sp. BR1]|uniref:polysaccharide pyruvyl transferase family protein n=1 Tax=Microbacterium sp. BR1 TaxID=1070896 RepID=UPI000C2C9432|nr:polysaccharide pyruvyl transferase family protein [Microbacterium sp. BR1]
MLVRLLSIGDIGVSDGMMHIGDEAMFEALRDEMRARGVELIAVSAEPAESADRYGIDAVPRIGFAGLSRDAADARMREVVAAAKHPSSLGTDDSAREIIDAVSATDGVVIAGGGNLASRWPVHIYERVTLAAIASELGRPVVVTGQTLGPDLIDADRALLAPALRAARLVGVRETRSLALAADLGVAARVGVDDASFLGDRDPGTDDEPDASAPPSGVLVSLSLALGGAQRDETVARLARLIDHAAELTGEPVAFHAHFGPLDPISPARGDAVLHDEVRARMTSPSRVIPTGDPRAAARLARSSALLITGRYHPAVFAAPAGVPVVGLVADDYTRIKQLGVLAHWGQDGVAPLADADAFGGAVLERVWSSRARIAEAAAEREPRNRAEAALWWDAVADAERRSTE